MWDSDIFLRRNLFIDPVQILSSLCYYKLQKPTFLMIFVVTIPFTEIKEKAGRRLLKIIQDTFLAKKIYHKCRILHLLTIFALFIGQSPLSRHFSKRCYWNNLLKSNFATLNFREDCSSSTTSLVCTAIIGLLRHILWCGLLYYPL